MLSNPPLLLLPKLLGSKYFGNYGSMSTDLIHSSNNVFHLNTSSFQKAFKTVKSFQTIWDGRVRGGGSNLTEEIETHNCCYITCLESLNQLLEVLDLNPGVILSLMLLPIHHADSIHNCQSVYLQNCHIKTDALPTYFRGVKHILMGCFFFATVKFPVIFLPLIFKKVFRNELLFEITWKNWA